MGCVRELCVSPTPFSLVPFVAPPSRVGKISTTTLYRNSYKRCKYIRRGYKMNALVPKGRGGVPGSSIY